MMEFAPGGAGDVVVDWGGVEIVWWEVGGRVRAVVMVGRRRRTGGRVRGDLLQVGSATRWQGGAGVVIV